MNDFFRKRFLFISKHWWETVIILLAVTGISCALIGFSCSGDNLSAGDKVYETFRMFPLNYQFERPYNFFLDLARWLILTVSLLVFFRLFFTIVAPRFILYKRIQYFYRGHIVICGLNERSKALIGKLKNEGRIVVISCGEEPADSGSWERNVKIVKGDAADPAILRTANIRNAARLFVLTRDDSKNIEISQSAYSFLKNRPPRGSSPLTCFSMVSDTGLKRVMQEAALFKYIMRIGNRLAFDGILFSPDEVGIKYVLNRHTDRIFSHFENTPSTFLIYGLAQKTEQLISTLAVFTTMERENLSFRIVEEDRGKIERFRKNYSFLSRLADIQFRDDSRDAAVSFPCSAIFVCYDDKQLSIKTAVRLRETTGKNNPAIFAFCESPQLVNMVLNDAANGDNTLENRNIHLIDLLHETYDYIIRLDHRLESAAELAHNNWREKNADGTFVHEDTYSTLSSHHRQSCRDQVLDNYIRTYISTGKKAGASDLPCPLSFSDRDRETLAIMEHRRWMVEKFLNGWSYGPQRNDPLKRHPDLVDWDELTPEAKAKDYQAITLMEELLNTRTL